VTSTSHAVRHALGFLFAFQLTALNGEEADAAGCDLVNDIRVQEYVSTQFSDSIIAPGVLEVCWLLDNNPFLHCQKLFSMAVTHFVFIDCDCQ
jgi:hypothetical protein